MHWPKKSEIFFCCGGLPLLDMDLLRLAFGSSVPYPSEKYESQLGWFFPIYGKIKSCSKLQTTNQII